MSVGWDTFMKKWLLVDNYSHDISENSGCRDGGDSFDRSDSSYNSYTCEDSNCCNTIDGSDSSGLVTLVTEVTVRRVAAEVAV